MDNLSLTTNDGWTYDCEEDIVLTPSPRTLKADWSQLPLDVYHIILNFYNESQIDYWSQITEQRKFYIPPLLTTHEQRLNAHYHMNKRLTLKQLGHSQSIGLWQVGRNPAITAMSVEEWDRRGRPHTYDWTQEDSDDPNNTFWGRQVSMTLKKLNHHSRRQKPYKVKVIKKATSKCRCSLCGKVGHNKNNRKYH